jgi:hypothetical protein
MDKTTTLIIVAALAFFLLLRRPSTIGPTVARPAYDYFGAPVPGPSYAVSPATAAHSTVSDILAGVNTGVNAIRQIAPLFSGGGSSGSDVILSDNSSGGGNLDFFV